MAAALQKWISIADPNAVSLVPRQIGNRGGGYGMVCKAPIKKGDKLVAVPRKLWMTSLTAKQSDICKNLILENQLESWQAVRGDECVVHAARGGKGRLLLSRNRRPNTRNVCAPAVRASHWTRQFLGGLYLFASYSEYGKAARGHAAVCAKTREFRGFISEEHPLLWTPEQQQVLKGSPMLKKLASRLEQVYGDTEHLRSVGANSMFSVTSEADELVTVNSIKWAAATLLSRAFNLEIPTPGVAARPLDRSSMGRDGAVDFAFELESTQGNGSENGAVHSDVEGVTAEEVECERILALVPWADTLNHSSEAWDRSILQYDHVEDVAVLFAHRDYKPGEEVYDSYGTWLTPSELLLDYGFVDAANRNYAIQVPAESIATPASTANAQLLSMLHSSLKGAPELTLTETGVDDTLLSYMRCALAPVDELANAGWDESSTDPHMAMNTMARLVEPCNFNTEAKVLETLLAWCDRQMAGYGSSLQSDIEEVESESTPWLSVQVLRALISEKKTVLGLQKELRTRNQLLKEGCPLDQLYV